MFGLIRKFDRCAVLADQKWLKTISEIEGALIPGLDIKGFNTDEEAARGSVAGGKLVGTRPQATGAIYRVESGAAGCSIDKTLMA